MFQASSTLIIMNDIGDVLILRAGKKMARKVDIKIVAHVVSLSYSPINEPVAKKIALILWWVCQIKFQAQGRIEQGR
jgi:hypothetical protein